MAFYSYLLTHALLVLPPVLLSTILLISFYRGSKKITLHHFQYFHSTGIISLDGERVVGTWLVGGVGGWGGGWGGS